jgi:hypothetical protein
MTAVGAGPLAQALEAGSHRDGAFGRRFYLPDGRAALPILDGKKPNSEVCTMSMLLKVVQYARTEMPDAFGDIPIPVSRAAAAAALGEVMRRMSYVPDPRNLMDAMAKWNGRFPITNPAEAKKQYRAMAADMNEPMIDALQAALERRAAGLPQIDWKRELKWVGSTYGDLDDGKWVHTDAWDDREEKEAGMLRAAEEQREAILARQAADELAASDEPMTAIVGRLLETAPLLDERWGDW